MKKLKLLLAVSAISASSIVTAQNAADRDAAFNVSGLGTYVAGTGQQYSRVTPLPGGKVLATGSFYSAATTTPEYAGVFRLNNDGSFDNTFNAGGVGAAGIIAATAIQADGKILIGGGFVSYNGTSLNGIARINADGSLDNSFNPGTGFSSILPPPWVRSIAIQPDGKIIVGGGFTSFNGTAIAGVCRLNADGTLDNTFSPGSGPNNIVQAVALQSDGKIIAGGVFASFNGVSTGRLVRLNADGSLDNTFSTATSGDILRVIIQPDGKILTSGSNFYRLESDGSLETGFPNATAGNSYNGLALQQDGKIILTGFFDTYAGVDREYIVRLNSDGSLDTAFDSEIGFSTNPQHIALQPDGKILAFGGFEYKGAANLITRITGTPQSVSVTEIKLNDNNINIFPNPTANQLNILSDGNKISAIAITDIAGKTVFETNGLLEEKTTINTGAFVSGLYLLSIKTENGLAVKRFLKH